MIFTPANLGKGGAVTKGFEVAFSKGFTHAVVFDSDGQHDEAKVIDRITRTHTPGAIVLLHESGLAGMPHGRRAETLDQLIP